MKLKIKGVSLEIGVLFAGVTALMLAADFSGTGIAALCVCVFHECGHLLCLVVLGDYPLSISLSFFGMRIDRRAGTGASIKDEIITALGGPAVNLLIFLLTVPFAKMHVFATVNLVCALFNMLPCLPLDGGRVLYFAMCSVIDESTACRVCRAFSVALALLCTAAGAALLALKGNFTLLAAAIYLVAANVRGNEYPV